MARLEQFNHLKRKKTDMNNLFWKYSLLSFIVGISFSCNNKLLDKEATNLLKTDIEKVVNIIEENNSLINSDNYYHFKIKSKYDDNIFIIDLVSNFKLPIASDSVLEMINYKDSYIFIYDKSREISNKNLNYLKEKHLISNDNNSPFFLPSTKYWNLLVEKRKTELIVKEVKLLLEKDKSLKEDNLTDF